MRARSWSPTVTRVTKDLVLIITSCREVIFDAALLPASLEQSLVTRDNVVKTAFALHEDIRHEFSVRFGVDGEVFSLRTGDVYLNLHVLNHRGQDARAIL